MRTVPVADRVVLMSGIFARGLAGRQPGGARAAADRATP
jgi:hypothetical protein